MFTCIIFGSILFQLCSCREDPSRFAFAARDGKGWGSETSSTFFDIALTALAFLSFGIFLLNLLLNALLFPTTVATTPLTTPDPILTMLPSGATGGAIITGGTGIVTGRSNKYSRRKRALFTPEVDSVTSAQALTSFVTSSIEAMTKKHECVSRVFCDGNRRARVIQNGYQYLFPLMSVSISYVGKLLRLHDQLPQHLDAIVLGYNEANCQSKFPTCKQ